MRPIILFCAGLMILCVSCKKSEPPKGSVYTRAISGSRSYYKIDSGYDNLNKAYWGDTSEVTITIVYQDDATAWFDSKKFSYESTTPDGLIKYRGKPGSVTTSSMMFDPSTNVIRVRESYHLSTGVVDQTTDYVSH